MFAFNNRLRGLLGHRSSEENIAARRHTRTASRETLFLVRRSLLPGVLETAMVRLVHRTAAECQARFNSWERAEFVNEVAVRTELALAQGFSDGNVARDTMR